MKKSRALLFGCLLCARCFASQMTLAGAQINQPEIVKDGIQNEIPVWPNGKAPLWNDRAFWARGQHSDPSRDTSFLRRSTSLGARFVVQARELVAKGKFTEAIAEYKRASNYGWVPCDEWGDLLEAQGNHKDALQAYRQMIYGAGISRDKNGDLVVAPSLTDWKDETGRSLREITANNLLDGVVPKSSWIMPSSYMRYALLLVKQGHIEEALQMRQRCVQALDQGSGEVIKEHKWLATPFTAEEVRRDPSLFIAQAWMIIAFYDTTRRTDDFPPLVALTRFKKAANARPDYAPAWIEIAEHYRAIGERWDEPGEMAFLPLAIEAYRKAANVRLSVGDTREASAIRDRAITALKEIQAGQKSTNPLSY